MTTQPQDPERSARDASGAVDVDPWVDFLSESSDALDLLKTELLTVPDPDGGASPQADAAADRTGAAALAPPTTVVPVAPEPRPSETVSVVVLATGVAPASSAGSDAAAPSIEAREGAPAEPPLDVTVADVPGSEGAFGAMVRPPVHETLLVPEQGRDGDTPEASDARPAAGDSVVPCANDDRPQIRTPPGGRIETPAEEAPRVVHAESGPVEGEDVAASMTLADVLARQIPVRPSEAVAVVEEVCAQLAREDGPAAVPDARHVRITAAGTVALVSGGNRERDVSALGRLLHALLATASAPLPLRLFVTSSISSPRFASIALYADALSHYAAHAGPDRHVAIGALCRRALEAPGSPPARRMSQPAIFIDARPGVPPGSTRRGRALTVAAACVAIAVSAAAGAWLGRTGAADEQVLSVGAPVLEPTSRPAEPSAPVVVGHDPWALGVITVPAGAASRPRAAASPATPVPGPLEPLAIVVPPQAPPAFPPVAIETPMRASSSVVRLPTGQPEASDADRTAAARPTNGGTDAIYTIGTVPASETIYSSADMDVEPPVVLSSGGLTLPPALPGANPRSEIELIINARGVVQQVQWVGTPEALTDMLPLSSLKYQRFRPAMKDGRPVPYRLLVR